jgi:hypothetical protein
VDENETLAAMREAYAALRAEAGDTPTDEQIAELTRMAGEISSFASTPAEAVEAEAESEETLVAASPAAPAAAPNEPSKALSLVASGDITGHPVGTEMDLLETAKAVVRKTSTFTSPARSRAEFSIAQIVKPSRPETTIRDNDQSAIDAAIAFARDERNLPGGSLVASGGWCSPSETWYDLLDYSSVDGLLSLPAVTLSRGGVRLIPGGGPQFAEIYADTGFCFTEAEDISGTYAPGTPPQPKPCYQIECPDWTDYRLEVCGVCITGGYLQNRAFPELTQDIIAKALKAHRHRVDTNIIADIVSGSVAVAVPTTGQDPGVAAPILNAVELQVLDIRSKYRMSESMTVEVKFPTWAKGVIRADLAYRNGVDMISVSDSMIDAWFRERNVSVQYLVNFQPLNTGANTVAYPSTISFLIYPAGTWVKGENEVIDLGVIHSPDLFAFNNYSALFTEEGWNVLPVGPESRVVELEICPSGATGAATIACDVS